MYCQGLKNILTSNFHNFQAEFSVEICGGSLAIMDIHSHLNMSEVIGLLGGNYSNNMLTITRAEPCVSVSTGVQCEMDPGKLMFHSFCLIGVFFRITFTG